jgi:2-dehydro-3-deoxygluconokinase
MIRLSPPNCERIEQASSLNLHVGGSESNTAVGLSRLGLRVAWVSRLPKSPLGYRVVQELRRHAVDTSHVVWSDTGRMGVYFVEYGQRPRDVIVLYDRDASAASEMKLADFDLGLVSQCRLIHLTGITPALGETCYELVEALLDEAGRVGTPRSFDVNYRRKLWSPEEAGKSLECLCKKVDILFVTRDDAQTVFECGGTVEDVARDLKQRFALDAVALTLGAEGAIAVDGSNQLHRVRSPKVVAVDRLGAGDAFSAGFLYGYLRGNVPLGIEMGTYMGALKYTIPGDLPLISRSDMESLLSGKPAPGVRR